MHSTGQESLWVPQPVTRKCFAVRVHRLRPSPASTCCSAGLAPTGHRADCECSCAGGLPAEASPSLPVCSPAVASLPWEAAASKPFGKWVELGEKGHPGVLTACGGAARAACYVCAHRPSFHHGHRGLAPCLQQAGRTEVFPMPDVLGIE